MCAACEVQLNRSSVTWRHVPYQHMLIMKIGRFAMNLCYWGTMLRDWRGFHIEPEVAYLIIAGSMFAWARKPVEWIGIPTPQAKA